MHKKLLIFFFILFFFSTGMLNRKLYAQNFSNNWYFGVEAGIGFNQDSVQVLLDGKLTGTEGTSSFSDSCGRLLYYSNGNQVWNKNHRVMKNGSGLNGSFSSSQSSLFVPKPGSDDSVYLFTVDLQGWANGFQYSIIDRRLDNGLGEVVQKNEPLLSPVCEKLSAVNHQNGKDVWILVHEYGSDAFYAYLLKDTGLVLPPVLSRIGDSIAIEPLGGSSIGCMKFSPQGDKLAIAHGFLTQLFDFDPATGVLSNALDLERNSIYSYGLEFSPNGQLLYLCGFGIFQYDLRASDISASRINVEFLNGFYGLQLGPDRKIYSAQSGSNSLNIIHKPNERGLACQVEAAGISLQGRQSKIGLPNFNQSYFLPGIWKKKNCQSDSFYFELAGQEYDSLFWHFDDPLSAKDSVSRQNPIKHQFIGSGEHLIQLRVHLNSEVLLFQETVFVPDFSLPSDTVLCEGQELILKVEPQIDLLWSTGNTSPEISVSSSGSYWVESNFGTCCSVRDSIQVQFEKKEKLEIFGDSILCPNESGSLRLENPNQYPVHWNTGDSSNLISIQSPGRYQASMEVGACLRVGEKQVGMDLNACPAKLILPNVFSPNMDGVNDVFEAQCSEYVKEMHTQVFNRQGILISDNFQKETLWNGRDSEGNLMESGLYYYLIEYMGYDLKEKNLQGWIMLVR